MFTIKKPSVFEHEINKSKFIGLSFAVNSKSVAESEIENIKKLHPKATHVCYGYKIGNIERFDDDGEPSHTAGMPILDCIRKQNLDNVLVIVVRYFGGVKLGAGGLVRAYSKTASNTLSISEVVKLEKLSLVEFTFTYEVYNQFAKYLIENEVNVKIENTEFLENVKVLMYSKHDGFTKIIEKLDAKNLPYSHDIIGESMGYFD